jgi:hypothetical protein
MILLAIVLLSISTLSTVAFPVIVSDAVKVDAISSDQTEVAKPEKTLVLPISKYILNYGRFRPFWGGCGFHGYC